MLKKKYTTVAQLSKVVRLLRKQGKRVVFTNGCFDVLHAGHVAYLEQARRKGDVLVVALNSDRSVRMLKGKGRPVQKLPDRLSLVAALETVDYVTTFGERDPLKVIMRVRPDVLVKGGDWAKKEIVGKDVVESYGGKIFSLPYLKGYSTSGLIERIRNAGVKGFKK